MRTVRALTVVTLLAALLVSGCGALTAHAVRPSAGVVTAVPPRSTLQAQATWLKGSPAKLTPIPGAAAWLGNPDLAAYRDSSGAELVYERAHDRVLTWELGYRTVTTTDTNQPAGYGVSDGTAAGFADAAVRRVYKGDIATMRRRVRHDDQGGGKTFAWEYDRYVNGIRVQDHVSVTASGHTGHTSRMVLGFTKPTPPAAVLKVGLGLPEAVKKAAVATRLAKWKFVSADLYVLPGVPPERAATFRVTLEDQTPLPPNARLMGGRQRLVMVGAATGGIAGFGF